MGSVWVQFYLCHQAVKTVGLSSKSVDREKTGDTGLEYWDEVWCQWGFSTELQGPELRKVVGQAEQH